MTEERAPYTGWPMRNLIEMLRELARHEHTDVSVAAQAAEEIEELRNKERLLTIEIERLRSKLETVSELMEDIKFHARTASKTAALR